MKPNRRELQFGIYLLLLSACTFAYFLVTDASWMRYQYDILFPISLLALQLLVYAWRAIDRLSPGLPRAALRASFSVFLVLAFAEQAALGLDQTLGLTLSRNLKFVHWNVMERPSDLALERRAQSIRSLLFDGPPTTVVTIGPQPAPSPQPAGSVWLITALNMVYESDGVEWIQPGLPPAWPPLPFAIAFPSHAGNGTEPLVELGESPTADALGVHFLPNQQLQFEYHHWGYATCSGNVLRYEPGSSHAFSLRLDAMRQRASLSMDGAPVLDCANGVYSRSSSKPFWGVNRSDFPMMLPAFSGMIAPQSEKTPRWSGKARPLRVNVTFPSSHASENEPLAQFGQNRGAADLLGVKYLPNAKIALFLDHWGGPECRGGSLPVRRDSPQVMDVSLDAGVGYASVALDGRTVLNCQSGVYPQSMEQYVLGKNTIGFSTAASDFSGSIQLSAQTTK